MTAPASSQESPGQASGAFAPADQPERPGAAVLGWIGYLALLVVLVAFIKSPGEITNRHRAMMAILGVSLPVAGWLVYTGRLSSMAWRLWLVFGAGFALSLSQKGEQLESPPADQAMYALIILALAAILYALASRGRLIRTGYEFGAAAAIVLVAAIMALLFRSVGQENSLDAVDVLQPAYKTLLDFGLLLTGLSILTDRRASYFRMAILIGIACLVRLAWRHGVPGS